MLFLKIFGSILSLRSTKSILSTFDDILNGRYSSASISKMHSITHRKTLDEIQQSIEQSNKDYLNDMKAMQREMKEICMTNPAMFDAFMNHLFSEYCGECMLSIIEFIQFKDRIGQNLADEVLDELRNEEVMVVLHDKMVKSKLVYDGGDYSKIAYNLYKKYIRVGAEWEININYRDRNKYVSSFEEAYITSDKKELYVVFDVCIKQMFSLLIGAFSRFKNSTKYQVIQRHKMRVQSTSVITTQDTMNSDTYDLTQLQQSFVYFQ